jgi:type II secretory pathway component PulM
MRTRLRALAQWWRALTPATQGAVIGGLVVLVVLAFVS